MSPALLAIAITCHPCCRSALICKREPLIVPSLNVNPNLQSFPLQNPTRIEDCNGGFEDRHSLRIVTQEPPQTWMFELCKPCKIYFELLKNNRKRFAFRFLKVVLSKFKLRDLAMLLYLLESTDVGISLKI